VEQTVELLPDDLDASTWTPEERWLIHQLILGQSHHGEYKRVLDLVRHAVKHIDALQDKIMACDAGCNCACDFEAPGDVCTPHYEYRVRK
jgi:hypothetical protein